LADGLADISCQLACHGITADLEFVPSAASKVGEMLMAMARSQRGSLLVMAGYGHSHLRVGVFGGFTLRS